MVIRSRKASWSWSAAWLSITGPMNGGRLGVRMVDDDPVGELADRRRSAPRAAPSWTISRRARGAALAGADEGGLDRDRRRGVDVLGVPDDERVVAAHLEREDLVRRVGELAVEREAGAGRAGEEQAVDARAARRAPCRSRARPGRSGRRPRARRPRGRAGPGISPTAGVFSHGLNTTALPASRAGTMWPLGRWAGKLYGPSTASTPCGLWRTATRAPSAPSSRRCEVRSA